MKNEETAGHIIALERAALTEWCRGNPSPCLALYAPEFTYFDPFTPVRWDLEQVREMYEQIRGQLDVKHFDMVEPKVQVHGDIAVLTFNYTSDAFDRMWNCTEVYMRYPSGGGNDPDEWRIIHNHWSDVHSRQ